MAYLKHFKKCEITRRSEYTTGQIESLRVAYRIAATNAASGHGAVILFNGRSFSVRDTTYYGERPRGELFAVVMPRDLRDTIPVYFCAEIEKNVIKNLSIKSE